MCCPGPGGPEPSPNKTERPLRREGRREGGRGWEVGKEGEREGGR